MPEDIMTRVGAAMTKDDMLAAASRNKSDTTHFGLRMREDQRAGIEAAAAESGRSMNAEIIHRIAAYEGMVRRVKVAEAIEARLLERAHTEFQADAHDHFLSDLPSTPLVFDMN